MPQGIGGTRFSLANLEIWGENLGPQACVQTPLFAEASCQLCVGPLTAQDRTTICSQVLSTLEASVFCSVEQTVQTPCLSTAGAFFLQSSLSSKTQ